MTTIEELAAWAADLSLGQVPERVVKLLKAQQLSVFGAMGASAGDDASRRVLSGLGVGSRPLPLNDPDAAVYAGAAMSVALDYDDYVCFGHTGHTSVLVPSLWMTDVSSKRRLEAQLAANEIGARLGGACLIGPLNGQLWSFIHCAEAAVAAGMMLGLDEKAIAQALAIALYQSPRPSVPGFMKPDSKLLTASEPAAVGVRAARLAAAAVTGPLDILDHPAGFFRAFSYAPIRGMLGGLGTGWATETLCVKPYPGCAYVDPVLDAVLELGPPKADEVESVRVRAGALTCGMDALSAEYATGLELTPVTINFSVSANIAIAIVGGRFTPEEVRPSWIAEHAEEISNVRRRVELVHDWSLTRQGSRGFAPLIPVKAVMREIGPRKLARGLRRMRGDHRGVTIGLGNAADVIRVLREQRNSATPNDYWDPAALSDFRMSIPAELEIELRAGEILTAAVNVPIGSAGHPTRAPIQVAEEKFARWAPELWQKSADDIADAIEADADELPQLVAGATLPA